MDDDTASPISYSQSGSVNRSETNQSESTTYDYEDDDMLHRGSSYVPAADESTPENSINNNDDNNNSFSRSTSTNTGYILPGVNTNTGTNTTTAATTHTHLPSVNFDTIGNVFANAQHTFLQENLQGDNESAVLLRSMIETHHPSSVYHQQKVTVNSFATLSSVDLVTDNFFHILSDLPDSQTVDYEIISSTADRNRTAGIGLLSNDSVTLWLKYKHFPIELKFRTNPSTPYLRVVAVNSIRFGENRYDSNKNNQHHPNRTNESHATTSHTHSATDDAVMDTSTSSSSATIVPTGGPVLLPPSHEFEIALYRHIQRVMDLLSLPDLHALLKDLLERFTYRSEAANKVKEKETIMERTNSSNQKDVLEFFHSTGINTLLSKRYPPARKILEGIRIAYDMLYTHCFVCGRILPDIQNATPLSLQSRIPTTATCGNDLCRHSETLSTRFVDMFTESRNTVFYFHYDFIVQAAISALKSNQREALMYPIPDAYVSATKTMDHDSLMNDIQYLLDESRGKHISACNSNAAIRLYFMTLTLRQAKVPGHLIIKAIQEIANNSDDPLVRLPISEDTSVSMATIKADKLYLLAWWLLRSLPLRLVVTVPDQLPFVVRKDPTFAPYISPEQAEKDKLSAPSYKVPSASHYVQSHGSGGTNTCPYQFCRIYTQSGLPAYISVTDNGDSRTVLPSVMEEEEEAEKNMSIPPTLSLSSATLSSRNISNGQLYTPVEHIRTVFHGSGLQTWLSILRVGLLALSNTKFMKVGAAYGPGVYFGPLASTSLSYSNWQGVSNLILKSSSPLVPKSTSNTTIHSNTTTSSNVAPMVVRNDPSSNSVSSVRGGSILRGGINRPTSALTRTNASSSALSSSSTGTNIVRIEDLSSMIHPELEPILQHDAIFPFDYNVLGIAHVDGRPRNNSRNTSSSSSSGSSTDTIDPIKDFGYCITSIEDNRNRLLYLVFFSNKNKPVH